MIHLISGRYYVLNEGGAQAEFMTFDNRDCYSNDIAAKDVTNRAECAKWCVETTGCVGFVYTPYKPVGEGADTEDDSTSHCWVKVTSSSF